MLPPGYTNGRTATQAVAHALTQVGQWRDSGYCLRFVGRVVYQRPWDGAAINQAHHVWDNAPTALRHERDFDAPRGAIVLWNSSIGSGAGHIAISLGTGKMVTTTGGAIAIRTIRGYSDHAYLGWMPPYFRSRP
jgi:cell wall-associated NlpC family hydrolase